MQKIRKFLEKNVRQIIGIVLAFTLTGTLFGSGVLDFQANLLAGKKSAPFDGTTAPVKKTPSWVDLSTTEWKNSYDQIPLNKFIDLPDYIPSQLTVPFASLNFSKASDKAIRNAQVTYSTPYMGNYKLDGQEYAGSHLAVDIKIPYGTPLYAIANGIVIKAANSSGGYGNHIILRHDDVPSIDNPNVLTTYYSGYGHMSSLSVAEGDSVAKGQLIGYSGNSGTTTTPHVHFQIDNDQAPWHLYWPYTSKEASDAGLSFWEAVNAGLGKEKALAATINPMVYVQKYRNYSSSGTSSTPVNNSTATTTPAVTPADNSNTTTVQPSTPDSNTAPDELPPIDAADNTPSQPVNISTQPAVDVTPAGPELADFEMKYNLSFKIGAEQVFKLIALDKDGQIIRNFQPKNEVYLKIENGSATLNKSYITAADFSDGVAQFTMTPTAGFGIRVSATSGNITKISEILQESSFTDLNQNDENFVAINFLKNNDIVKGYPDGSFKPASKVSRVEALKFIYEGLNKEVRPKAMLEFADTDSKAWYARYIAAAQKDGVIKGYAGNLFKPANSVTRAEFIKMLMEASGFDGKSYVPSKQPYSDVVVKDWYYTYIGLARDKNLLDTSTNLFRPNQEMTRSEVAQILYKTILMKASGKIKFENGLVVNADDIASFYSKV